MADINSLTGFLGDVANAIREKDGIVGNIYPKDYDNRIRNISSSSKVDNLYSFSFRDGKATSYDDNIASINTNCVQNLDNAFYNCTNLTTLSEFNTSNVKSMKNMLYNCNKLSNQSLNNIANLLPLYSNITDSTKNPKLDYLGLLQNQIDNISESLHEMIQNKGWSIGELLEYIVNYINNGEYFSNIITYKNDTSNGKVLRDYLNNIPSTVNNISIEGLSEISNFYNMFYYRFTNIDTIYLNLLNHNSMPINFANVFSCSHNKIQNIVLNIDENLIINNMSHLFAWKNNINILYICNILNYQISNCSNLQYMFYGHLYPDKHTHICPNLNFNNSNLNYNICSIFSECNSINSFPDWDFQFIKDASGCFYQCYGIVENTIIPNWNMTNVQNIRGMLYSVGTNSYKSYGIKGNIVGNIPNWNLSNCTNCELAFGGLPGLTGTLPKSIPSKVNSIGGLFYNCRNITGTIPNWNTSHLDALGIEKPVFGLQIQGTGVLTMCNNLTGSIPNWNTSNIKIYCGTFNSCSNLTGTIPTNFISNYATDVSRTFADCHNLIGSIPNWNASNWTSVVGIFVNCWNLTGTIPNWDLSNCKDLTFIVKDCLKLTGSIPNWNMANVRELDFAFYGCSNLTGSIPNWTLNNCGVMGVFQDCKRLTGVINLNIIGNTGSGYGGFGNMFRNCLNITDFIGIWNMTNVSNIDSMFTNCNNLSNSAILNIIQSILTINTSNINKNLMINNYHSPFYQSKFDNSYYTEYHSQLTTAGWTF